MNKQKRLKAFSLIELVLAIAIFSVVSSFLVYLVVDSTRTFENLENRASATHITKEIYSALKYLKSEEWFTIRQETDQGAKHIEYVDGKYIIEEGETTLGSIKHFFTIDLAQRDANGMLVENGGTIDPHTRVVNININWTDRFGKTHAITPKLYLNDWNINSIVLTTKDDFNQGTHKDTAAAEATGGELRLQSVLYPDWCRPERMLNKYDIPGEARAKSVFTHLRGGEIFAYLGTRGGGENEDPFTKLKIQGVAPPTLSVEGIFRGYKVNDIYVDGDYAYLATTDNDKEIVILDLTQEGYPEIGYVNGSGDYDANTVTVKGNVGYMGQGRYVRTFDLSSKEGSRPVLNSVDLSTLIFVLTASVSQIIVRDVVENGVTKTYLYASLNWDWYEFNIIDVTNPSKMKTTSQTSVNEQQVYDMYVSEDSNTVFFGTNASSQKEFYIIDTTSKSGKRPILAEVETNGMTVRGIEVVERDKLPVAILVGTGGEEYQVYSIADLSNPVKCGGMQENSGIYDVATMVDAQKNTFSYIVTGDPNNEFHIIRGGPGGGEEETGNGFLPIGTFTSNAIDSKSDTSEYYTVTVDAEIPEGTTMEILFKFADTEALVNATTTPWRGIERQGETIIPLTTSGTYMLPIGARGRYLKYKVEFKSDTEKAKTALLKELIFEYEK